MIIRTAVQRPVAVMMLFAGLVLIGALSFNRLPVDLLPAINYPNLTVITNYSEVPADDLTRLVTRPLEERITGLAGVRNVVSSTREGVSSITVQYEWGTEMEFANLHLREAVDQVAYREDFPEQAERPLILRWDPGARPIAIITTSGDNLAPLTEFCREVVKPAIEQIDGLSQAEVIGGADREILVQPDLEKLRLYGLTMAQLQNSLRTANVSFPGGRVRKGPLHLPLRILGEFESLDDIRQTEIPGSTSGVITVNDVAQVIDTTSEPTGSTLLAGSDVVSIMLYKEVGANTIDVSKDIEKILTIVSNQYQDFSFDWVYRDADFVEESFRGLRDSMLGGALLALLVLFFFLRDWRSPLVVGLSIPIGIMSTFAFMYFSNVKLNLMSLGGLSLAAGMLVDNAIVVLENIRRHLGLLPDDADVEHTVAEATSEVASPVIAATLTTVAVFFPVVYVPGIAGEFFRDQALTVTIALLVSVASALLLQPTLSAKLLSAGTTTPRGIFKLSDKMFTSLHNNYHKALISVLQHKRTFLFAVLLLGLVSGFFATGLDRTFLPERNSGDFTLSLELPSGTPLEGTVEVTRELSSKLATLPQVHTVFSQVGETEKTLAALKEYTAPNTSRIRVLLHRSRNSAKKLAEVKSWLENELSESDGIIAVLRDEGIGLSEILASGGQPFSLGVVAEDPDDAITVAEELLPKLRAVPGLSDIAMDRVLGNPAMEVTINRENSLRHGVDPESLARELQSRVQGTVATTYNEVDQRIDIAVRLPKTRRQNLDEILASPIAVNGGKTVPLGSFVDLSEGRPVREVVRRNQRRQITLSSDITESINAIWENVNYELSQLSLPEGVAFITGGEQEEINSSFRDLGWALLLSALLVYMILAAQFESFLDPLIISAVLPVGIIGAAITLLLTGNSINIISLIGLIALLGISVNDAIVKVSTIRRLRLDGLSRKEAILEASTLRFRPIIMTTMTTVLAMIPMAIGLGSGEQIQRPLAITIIGGLTMATLLTLFLTPVIYEVFHSRADKT
ncbi:MAG: efflux RND transporter permease subunit [bacterium]|nr:efflux RND transporter permease subunit [bacterium]MCP4800640.1 efflux RND transporter permease subunit [bacterium]